AAPRQDSGSAGGNGGNAASVRVVPPAYGLCDAAAGLKFGPRSPRPLVSTRNIKATASTRRSSPILMSSTSILTSPIGSPIGFRSGPAMQHTHSELTNALHSTSPTVGQPDIAGRLFIAGRLHSGHGRLLVGRLHLGHPRGSCVRN